MAAKSPAKLNLPAYPDPVDFGFDVPETPRWLSDRRLRDFRFRLRSRPKRGPVLWERDGVVYTEDEAHAVVTREIKSTTTRK